MVEEDPAGGGELDAADAADHELSADLVLQILHLAAQRRLRRVQPPLGGNREAAFLGDGDEVAKMSQLHDIAHACEVWGPTYKVFFLPARRTYVQLRPYPEGLDHYDQVHDRRPV